MRKKLIPITLASAGFLTGCGDPITGERNDGLAQALATASGTFQEITFDPKGYRNSWGKNMGYITGDGLPDLLVGDYGAEIYWYRAPNREKYTLSRNNGGDDLI